MHTHPTKRKLTAILSADIAGFSRSMERDEVGTHRALGALRETTDAIIARHGGRIVGTAGDSILADFPSVVDALDCAVEMQRAVGAQDAALPLRFRVGINVGDVIVDGNDIFGDGVNIAARLQALAAPGGICISGSAYDQVRNKLAYAYRYHGTHTVKNISEPVRVYSVDTPASDLAPMPRKASTGRWPMLAALGALVILAGAFIAWQQLARIEQPVTLAPSAATEPQAAARGEPSAVPTVAVLPFANQSGDAGQEYFSDGITEDIIAALGRFSNLSVIARGATFQYKGKTLPPEQISRELGARYLVEGSVRRVGDQVRVTAQLVDASRSVHLWSAQYDERLEDVFAVQDRVTRGVAGALASRLDRIELERAAAKPAANLTAYDYVLRGRERLALGTRSANLEAQKLFETAARLDPNYAAADVGLARALFEMVVNGWSEFREATLARAEFLARRALNLDPDAAHGHQLLGLIHLQRADYDLALSELDLAIEANASDAASHLSRGAALMWAGYPDEAIAAIAEARRLNPVVASGTYMNLGFAYYLARRYDDAVRTFEQGLARERGLSYLLFSQVGIAAAYAQLGRQGEAVRAGEKARQMWPFFEGTIFVSQFRKPEHRAHAADGLRKAGLLD